MSQAATLAHATTSVLAQPLLGYKPCGCLGVISPLSNRGCHRCFSSHWLKQCQDCSGSGTLTKAQRQTNSQPRLERCGRCMGTGWVPCPQKEVQQAEAACREPEVVEVPEFVEEQASVETPAHRTPSRKAKLAESKQRRKPGPQPGFKKRREEEAAAAKAKSQPSLAPETVEPQAEAETEAEAEVVEVPAGSFTGDLS